MDELNLLQLEEPVWIENNAEFADYSLHLFPSNGPYSFHIKEGERSHLKRVWVVVGVFLHNHQLSENNTTYSFQLAFSFKLDEAVKCACFSTDQKRIFIFMRTKTIQVPVDDLENGDFNPENVNCDLTYKKAFVSNGNSEWMISCYRSNIWIFW